MFKFDNALYNQLQTDIYCTCIDDILTSGIHAHMLIHAEAQQDPEKYRFEVELEFVQCLANPHYINCESLE